MQNSYIEPDPGQQIKLEINDYDDAVFAAFKYGYLTFIGDMQVKVLDYEVIGVLVHQNGHKALVWVEGV